MKKIISLLLLLACVFAFAACSPTSTGPKDIFTLAKSSVSPTRIVTDVTYQEKDGGSIYTGHYVTESEGQNAIMTYEYTRPARLDEAADSETKTVKGTIYYKDGKVSTDGDTYETEALVWSGGKFALDKGLLADIQISEDERTLTATLTPENAEKILGTKFDTNGNSNITLTVKSNGTYITNVNITYTSPSGAAVAVRTSRSYNAIQLDFGGNA
ncbi:MAG TPA: hypothetical protein DDY70_05740 [Clostridiales bacterium]|nr:hypothetical protein [Clostridiales bacterium]